MSDIKRIANKFQVKLGQLASAQSADIQDALAKAGLWELSNQVAPMLNTARVPETASVQINLIVDKTLNVNFNVVLTPQSNASAVLSRMLKANFGAKMHQALAAAKLNVAETLTVKWLSF